VGINPFAIIGMVLGLAVAGALVLYFGWRATILSLAAFALWLRAIAQVDFPRYWALPLLVILSGIVYFAEMIWRRKAFRNLAEILGASWQPHGYWDPGSIAGRFNGRNFKINFFLKGEGRYSEKWIAVTIACASAGWNFSLPGDSLRVFGSTWLARRRDSNAQANDAAKRRLYGELAFLRSRDARLFHEGTLATGGFGLEWTCGSHIGFNRLPATLRCLDEIAGEVENGPAGRPQGLSSPA